MKAKGTAVYLRQHKRGLTMPQQSAIDLLAAGKTDKETAELLRLSRTAVAKRRLYDPVFQAALNRRRAEVWGAAADRLRALIPQALNLLADILETADGPLKFKAAVEILKLAQLPGASIGIGPTDPEAIVRGIVQAERQQARSPLDDLIENRKDIPPFEAHIAQTWERLEARAAEPDESERQESPPADLAES